MHRQVLGIPIHLASPQIRRSLALLHGLRRPQSGARWYGGYAEQSEHTSIQERLQPEFDLQQAIDDQTECGDLLDFTSPLKPLLPFENRLTNELQNGILFNFEEYLALVDWTGRIIRSDKRGHIDNTLPPILNRLQITPDQWRINTTQFEAIHPRRFNLLTPRARHGIDFLL